MRIFDKAFGGYKNGKRVKIKSKAVAKSFESDCSISQPEYPHENTGNSISDQLSIYEWSIEDNMSSAISKNDDSCKTKLDEPFKNGDNPDPLDDLLLLCPRDAPVKSPLQSSTMRLDINHRLDTPIPNHQRRKEGRPGPVDVDDFLDNYDGERSVNFLQSTASPHRCTDIDKEMINKIIDLAGVELSTENLHLQEREIQNEVELNYSISSGSSSCCGSEIGDSLRNLGDEDMECKPIPPGEPQRNSKEKDGDSKIKSGCNKGRGMLSSRRKEKRKKSLKSHVISTFQTLLRHNNQNIDNKRKDSKSKPGIRKSDLKKQLSLISMIPMTGDEHQKCFTVFNLPDSNKRELKKDLSYFSTTPLTGDSMIDFPKTSKLQNAKKMLLEKERRQILDYNIQRRREKKKELDHQLQLCEKELKRQQELLSDKTLTPSMMAKIEANRNRQKLQNWVMGCSNLTMGNHSGGASIISSALPWLNGKEEKEVSGSRISDASTAIIDNTLPNPNKIAKTREESKKVEANSSDEGSSASTPVVIAPSLQKTLCVECEKRKRTHLCLPCMHFSYCEDCVVRLEKKNVRTCTVCNERNVTFSKVLF